MALNPNITLLKLCNHQQYVRILQHCHDIASKMSLNTSTAMAKATEDHG